MIFKDGTFIPSDEGMEIISKSYKNAIDRKDVIALFEDERVRKEVPEFCDLMIAIINLLPSIAEKNIQLEELQHFDYPPRI